MTMRTHARAGDAGGSGRRARPRVRPADAASASGPDATLTAAPAPARRAPPAPRSYSCEDHFYERDTEEHCWELLASIVADSRSDHTVTRVGPAEELPGGPPHFRQDALRNRA